MRTKPVLMKVCLVGEDGSTNLRTVRYDQLVPDMETVRSELTDDLRNRLRRVYDIIGRLVTRTPRTQWVESFNVNMNPEREAAIWEAIVRAWEELGGRIMSERQSRKTLFVLLNISSHVVDVPAVCGVSEPLADRCRTALRAAMSESL